MAKIFISYRRADSAYVAGHIYASLIKPLGPFEPDDIFKDVDSIPLGADFKEYLDSQVAQCQIQLVIIGRQWVSITDSGGQRRLHDLHDYVRIEVESALARNIPIIPLLVDGATMPSEDELPPSLQKLVYRNGTPIRPDPDFRHDIERVIKSLKQWAELNDKAGTPQPVDPSPAPPANDLKLPSLLRPKKKQNVSTSSKQRFALPLLEWINIPAGNVTVEMGWYGEGLYSSKPIGIYNTAPFMIAKYPVTNAQFQVFIDDQGYQNDRWWEGLARRFKVPKRPAWSDETLPRESVSWYEAVAFCRWLADKTGLQVTLPTEAQWQWAAVGDTGWKYPYGRQCNTNLCNVMESGFEKTTPVNFFDDKVYDKTAFGVMDMCGNVWEWCLNKPDDPDDVSLDGTGPRIVRGGSWSISFHDGQVRATISSTNTPAERLSDLGFRVISTTPLK